MTGAGSARIVLSPNEGERVQFGGLGVRFMIEGAQSGGTFPLVEHPIAPREIISPAGFERYFAEAAALFPPAPSRTTWRAGARRGHGQVRARNK
jgi:hypothetical protein